MVSLLIKILFFYLLFFMGRNIYRTYKTISFIRGKMNRPEGQSPNDFSKRPHQKTSDDSAIEAEFRVLDEKDT